MFQRFDEIYINRHDYAREWKERTGGKVMGYFCTYAPRNINRKWKQLFKQMKDSLKVDSDHFREFRKV